MVRTLLFLILALAASYSFDGKLPRQHLRNIIDLDRVNPEVILVSPQEEKNEKMKTEEKEEPKEQEFTPTIEPTGDRFNEKAFLIAMLVLATLGLLFCLLAAAKCYGGDPQLLETTSRSPMLA